MSCFFGSLSFFVGEARGDAKLGFTKLETRKKYDLGLLDCHVLFLGVHF